MTKEILQAIIFAQLVIHGSCSEAVAFERAASLSDFYFKQLSNVNLVTSENDD